MRTTKAKTQPTALRSLVHSTELPFIQQGQNILIDARLLHKQLKVKSKFADWIKNRIADFGFVEHQDYHAASKSLESGGLAKDYHLTIDMAKELAMLERNEVGRAIRRYFIEKEKEARGISILPREAQLFKGMRAEVINKRKLYPYREMLVRCGYTANNNGGRRQRYPGHFVEMGGKLFVSEEFALHLYHQKQVYNNRTAMQAMQPVLPMDFGAPLLMPVNNRR